MLWHIFQNDWEDKEFISQRVWGMEQIRAEVAKWTPAEVERVTGRAWRAAAARREDSGDQQARHRDLVHGRHAAHHRQQQHPRLLHPAAGTGQHGRRRRRHQHLPGPRQRPGRHGHGSRCDDPACLLRPGRGRLEALVPGLGRRLRVGEGQVCRQGVHGEGRASRSRAGSTACSRTRPISTSPTTSRPWSSGAMRPTRRPACRT